jgi:hypothetical protein
MKRSTEWRTTSTVPALSEANAAMNTFRAAGSAPQAANRSAMAAQDDARERQMLALFNLERPPGHQRGGIDAVLELEGRDVPSDLQGRTVPFELKSATKGNADFSTGRDIGLHTIERWRTLHWLFAVYDTPGDERPSRCYYGSPARMSSMFDTMTAYIEYDVRLGDLVPELITLDITREIFGDAERFEPSIAKRLMKNQYGAEQYRDALDFSDPPGYSLSAMHAMLKDRCGYLIARGGTRNNPHFPATYFASWEPITRNHAAALREQVLDALKAKPGDSGAASDA